MLSTLVMSLVIAHLVVSSIITIIVFCVLTGEGGRQILGLQNMLVVVSNTGKEVTVVPRDRRKVLVGSLELDEAN